MYMEIMFNDLRPEKQIEVLEFLGLDDPQERNYDVIPLFVITDIYTIINIGHKDYNRVVISLLASKHKRKGRDKFGSKGFKRKT